MKIRKLREKDLAELIDLYSHYVVPASLPPLTRSTVSGIWKKIKGNPSVSYFVLETQGKMAASCILSITPSFIRGGRGFGLIEHVVTHREFRRKGFARSLLKFTLDHAWKRGCTEVMLLSGSENKIAHQLYESLGFDQSKRKGFITFKP